ncbi:polyprenyl synthetase family protein [Myxococcota bacterium]|nr:polyprenyl synthetase family protein [Myxococcota bacterium]MBU1379250.1 polyprenyl synthetase family protein [Myxococcota bacterium]MBU1496116.1 polyprenyl synthetase family protein [Myxococcota bacterium]
MKLPHRYDFLLETFENHLKTAAPAYFEPPSLRKACTYSLFAGGKRIRPVLCLACYEGLTGSEISEKSVDILNCAMAIEFIHTYSLIHDDLPAIDNDDFRRGKPSNHKAFGEAMAILSGDALLSAAFVILADTNAPIEVFRAFSYAALGMVSGQVLDTCPGENTADFRHVNALKTGLMLALPFETALAITGAMDENQAVKNLGLTLGELFQITDDILDCTGTYEELGKTPGKDASSDKLTSVAVLGLEGAKTLADSLAARCHHFIDVSILENKQFFADLTTFIHHRKT